jgi:hypothetical protein
MNISVGDNIIRDVLSRSCFDMMSLPTQDTQTRRNQGTARHEVCLRSKTHIITSVSFSAKKMFLICIVCCVSRPWRLLLIW